MTANGGKGVFTCIKTADRSRQGQIRQLSQQTSARSICRRSFIALEIGGHSPFPAIHLLILTSSYHCIHNNHIILMTWFSNLGKGELFTTDHQVLYTKVHGISHEEGRKSIELSPWYPIKVAIGSLLLISLS